MRPHFLAGTVLIAILLCKPTLSADVQWLTDGDKACAAMKDKQRPLLIYLTTDHCHFCTLMQQQTFGDPGVAAEINQSFVPIKLDNITAQGIVTTMNVTMFPTTIVISPKREVLMRVNGFLAADKFKQRLAGLTDKTTKR